jgi:hypothetical protein
MVCNSYLPRSPRSAIRKFSKIADFLKIRRRSKRATPIDFRRNSTDFSEGLASLSEGLRPTITEEAKFVYIDKKGAITLFTHFFYAGPFRDGMAVVYDAERKKWGYIDKSGKVVIPPRYDTASNFSEGLACVAIRETK